MFTKGMRPTRAGRKSRLLSGPCPFHKGTDPNFSVDTETIVVDELRRRDRDADTGHTLAVSHSDRAAGQKRPLPRTTRSARNSGMAKGEQESARYAKERMSDGRRAIRFARYCRASAMRRRRNDEIPTHR